MSGGVEKALRKHERQIESERRLKQLSLIKSAMFRMELQDLYVANFLAFNDRNITLGAIAVAEIGKIKEWQQDLKDRSDTVWNSLLNEQALPRVLDEYVKAAPVWRDFKQFALMCDDLDYVFKDMISIQHLIADVTACKKANSGDGRESSEVWSKCAAEYRPRVVKVWKTGIMKFVDYAVELKRSGELGNEEDATNFQQMMDGYAKAEKRAKEKEEAERRVKEREVVKDNVSAVTAEIFQQTRIVISEERS